ncbi:MAG: hypothetical protein EOS27_25395 [Mesorhizobium sp.]|nr:MAG: hypothetical protein EOS27_25395 [Mesorhizobium sp.]
MNTIPENHRETGARKLQSGPNEADRDRESIEAAENKPPADGQGLSQHIDDKTRQSEGRATPSPETRKFAGAGPALAEHSKDAKAPRRGRQPGAYVKD